MTAPKRLTLAPLDIPVEHGMTSGSCIEWINPRYQFGLDVRGRLYLVYTNGSFIGGADRHPRISVRDPHWNANHGLRYIDWYTP